MLQIVRDLDRLDGVDVYELAERYGTTTRTVRRDLAAVEELGFPLIEARDGKRKRWRIASRGTDSAITRALDASHYLALRAAMADVGHSGAPASTFAALEDLCDRIERAVGRRGRRQLEAIERCFIWQDRFTYRAPQADILWTLVHAIEENRVCRISYRTPGRDEVSSFEALPLRLFSHDRTLYLFASRDVRDEVVTLNLHRVASLELTRRRRARPKRLDLEALAASAFGVFTGGKLVRYRLRFTADSAPYIRERIWHPSQHLRELPGGSVVLEFSCSASYEVVAWVASWRHHVEVVTPKSLQDELGELGRWLGRRYARTQARKRRR